MTMADFALYYDSFNNNIKILVELLQITQDEESKRRIKKQIKTTYKQLDELIHNVLIEIK